MDEFELIDDILRILAEVATDEHVLLGPGDDCAVIQVPEGKVVVSSIDSLVGNVHFPAGAAPELIGYRAMAVNLSDLAAMGAVPAYALIALTLPDANRKWLEGFATGVTRICRAFRCPVIGGNMARGPINITVSIHGFCGTEYLARSGAQAGDVVCVTGPLGAAGLALNHPELSAEFSIQELSNVASSDPRYPLRRYYLPEPRVAIGQRMVGIASAAIDLSDGLAADLRHICEASAVGAELAAEKVPLSPGCSLNSALHGGDDYELCLTIPRSEWRHAVDLAHEEGLALCAVGEVTHQKTMVLTRDGAVVEALAGGYQHFKH